jgi:hypothetical protein
MEANLFSWSNSLPQLTTASGTYSYAYLWIWDGSVATVTPGRHPRHLHETTSTAFTLTLTFLSSLPWGHWRPLAMLSNFILFNFAWITNEHRIAFLLCCQPASP